ncbi:MAG TPA: replicative DNA helicase [Kiritimatiellia bacterium]|nr:replicative DNA helicase [Kiritimatiellia bacterium]
MAMQATPPAGARSDRLPPYSEDAERGVLGAALLDASRVIDLAVERGLSPAAFYVPAHQVLFEVLGTMLHEGRPVDLLTVGDRLRAISRLDEVGGAAFLERLVDATPTAAHADYYIDIVRQKHLLRLIIERSREAVDCCYGSEEEADAILGKTEQSFFSITETQRSSITPWPDLVKDAVTDIENIFAQKKGVTGLPTGYHDLDQLLMGLQPSDMIILAARPSMGKTSLALNIAENIAVGTAAQGPQPVAVFSLEMSKEQLVRRMICSRAGVSSSVLSRGFVSKESHQSLINAADALMKAQILLDDSAGLEVLELRSRARRLKRKHNIQLIVVDYLQMLSYPQFGSEGRQRETAAISGALKAMAKELKIPVLVLSQLSRAPETRSNTAVPKLSDLRDSGSIEQDADVVLMLRRPCMYPEDERHEDRTLAVIDVAKHRNGPTGMVELNFESDFTRFENRARGVDADRDFGPAAQEGEL